MLLALLLILWPFSVQASELAVEAPSGNRLYTQTFSGQGTQRLIMIPSRQGFESGYARLTEQLTALGVDVWQPDWFGSYLRDASESALNAVPAEDAATLLQQASLEGKTLHVIAFGRGAPLALNAWRAWQQAHPVNPNRGGLLLVSPNLVTRTPDPGENAEFLATAFAMNAPIWLFQPQLSPYYPGMLPLTEALSSGGSSVWLEPLPGMRDRFFYRPDANAQEAAYAPSFAERLQQAMRLLADNAAHQPRSLPALDRQRAQQKQPANTGRLMPLNGMADRLQLPDLQGQQQDLANFKGQVVLLNFWASWCPPCVHEMPSMQRLADAHADRGLQVIAVNLSEDPHSVSAFVREHALRFAIWHDASGQDAKRWKVFAYPTSFLIDRQGRLRYALAGGADWMSAELVEKVNELLNEH